MRGTIKILLACAVMAGSSLWFAWRRPAPLRSRSDAALTPANSGVREAHATEVTSKSPGRLWTAPAYGLEAGAWQFDVFTPPEIRYDRSSGRFSVRTNVPQLESVADASRNMACGVELLAVRRDPFVLQLVGYVGGKKAQGFFENTMSGETCVAGTGNRFPELHLLVERFRVTSEAVPLIDGVSCEREVATAAVRNELTGAVTTLRSDVRCIDGMLVATIAIKGGPAATCEVREGDSLHTEQGDVAVSKISMEPAALQLVRSSALDPSEERLTLIAPPSQNSPADPTS